MAKGLSSFIPIVFILVLFAIGVIMVPMVLDRTNKVTNETPMDHSFAPGLSLSTSLLGSLSNFGPYILLFAGAVVCIGILIWSMKSIGRRH